MLVTPETPREQPENSGISVLDLSYCVLGGYQKASVARDFFKLRAGSRGVKTHGAVGLEDVIMWLSQKERE